MKKFLLNLLAGAFVAGSASTAFAQDHNFEGSYIMSNFYVEYATDNYSMDDLPLVIGADNIITDFAYYTPFSTITGKVEGNEFTLTCEDEYFILDIDWDTFHYIVLNGETYGDDYEPAPITITYNPEDDMYEMTSWMLWDYDPMNGTFEKIASCMMFGLYPGEIQEDVDYTGSYTVKGIKTVFTDGVASESEEEFIMTMQPDGTGLYEFTSFAGYQVGMVPRGWLGVYGAVYGTDVELQGTDIELSENGDGIKLAAPYPEYDSLYTVTIFFKEPESGTLSDFSVWKMEAGEPVEMLAKWTALTFTKGNNESGILAPAAEVGGENQAPVYYDMRGMKVQNPSGGIYILKQGNDIKKVVIGK